QRRGLHSSNSARKIRHGVGERAGDADDLLCAGYARDGSVGCGEQAGTAHASAAEAKGIGVRLRRHGANNDGYQSKSRKEIWAGSILRKWNTISWKQLHG